MIPTLIIAALLVAVGARYRLHVLELNAAARELVAAIHAECEDHDRTRAALHVARAAARAADRQAEDHEVTIRLLLDERDPLGSAS